MKNLKSVVLVELNKLDAKYADPSAELSHGDLEMMRKLAKTYLKLCELGMETLPEATSGKNAFL